MLYCHFCRTPTVWLQFERESFQPTPLWGLEGRGGSGIGPFDSLCVVSYWLHIDIYSGLSLTVLKLFSICTSPSDQNTMTNTALESIAWSSDTNSPTLLVVIGSQPTATELHIIVSFYCCDVSAASNKKITQIVGLRQRMCWTGFFRFQPANINANRLNILVHLQLLSFHNAYQFKVLLSFGELGES